MAQTKKKKIVKKAAKKSVVKKAAKKPAMKMKPMKKAALKTAPMKKPSSLSAIPSKMITPLDDRIIVAVDQMPEKTQGGIIIPGVVAERPNRGTVMAAGPGRRNKKGVVRPLDVNVGDVVLFPQYAGQKIEIGANEFLILREEEILGISIA